MDKELNVSITSRTVVTTLLILAGVYVFWLLRDLALLVLTAIIIASLLLAVWAAVLVIANRPPGRALWVALGALAALLPPGLVSRELPCQLPSLTRGQGCERRLVYLHLGQQAPQR